jgi:hypothetical protein
MLQYVLARLGEIKMKLLLALLMCPSVALADWAIPPTLANPGCTTVDDFVDGHKGAAWISRSIGSQYPIMFYPATLCGEIDHVEIWNSGTLKVADANFMPYNIGACGKDGRVRFKATVIASALLPYAPLVVRAYLVNGDIDCREVADPTQDYD